MPLLKALEAENKTTMANNTAAFCMRNFNCSTTFNSRAPFNKFINLIILQFKKIKI